MAKCQRGIGELKDNYISRHISRPVCWPTVDQLSTDFWPTVGPISTNISTNISLEATCSKHDPTKLHYACVSKPNLRELLKLLKHFKNNQKCCDDFVTNSPQQVTKSMRMHDSLKHSQHLLSSNVRIFGQCLDNYFVSLAIETWWWWRRGGVVVVVGVSKIGRPALKDQLKLSSNSKLSRQSRKL